MISEGCFSVNFQNEEYIQYNLIILNSLKREVLNFTQTLNNNSLTSTLLIFTRTMDCLNPEGRRFVYVLVFLVLHIF